MLIKQIATVGLLLFCISAQALAADSTPTCAGTEEQTLGLLQRLRNALECAGSKSIEDCRNTIMLEKALAVGGGTLGLIALGRQAMTMANLRLSLTPLCKETTTSIFSSTVDAAPMTCNIDNSRFRQRAKAMIDNFRSKLSADIVQGKTDLELLRLQKVAPVEAPAEVAPTIANEKLISARLSNSEGMMRDLLKVLKEKPEAAVQDANDRYRKLPLTSDQVEKVQTRIKDIEGYLKNVETAKHAGPEVQETVLESQFHNSPFGFFDRLQIRAEITDIRARLAPIDMPSTPAAPSVLPVTSEQKFLRTLAGKSLSDQVQLLEAKMKDLPNLKDYYLEAKKVQALQQTQSSVFLYTNGLNSAKPISNGEVTKVLSNIFNNRIISPAGMSEVTRDAAREAAMFTQASEAAFGRTVNASVRQSGSMALARFVAMGGRGIGARAVLAGAGIFAHMTGWAATLALHSADVGHSDDFACSNIYAEFKDKEKCEIAPVIGPQTLKFLYDLPEKEQVNYLKGQQQFCRALQEIDESQGPKSWIAQCTNTGKGFDLTSKVMNPATKLDFQTNDVGQVTRLRYLTPNLDVGGGRAQSLGANLGDFQDNNLAIDFEGEAPKSVLQLKDPLNHNPDLLHFSDSSTFTQTPYASNSFDSKTATNLAVYQGSILAASEVQMCCTATAGNIDDVCQRWHLNRVQPGGASKAVPGSK